MADAPNFTNTWLHNCFECLYRKDNKGKGVNAKNYCSKYRFYFGSSKQSVCNSFKRKCTCADEYNRYMLND